MREEFAKLKRKFMLAAIVKSIVVGVVCGLFAVGVILLSLKLSAISLNAGFYALIGIATAFVCGAGVFLIIKPTDYRVAKKLDSEYGLNERAQTALAYQGQDGDMVQFQREDTRAALSQLKMKKPTFRQIWQYVLVGIVSLALFVTAVAIPKSIANGQGGEDNPPPTWEELPFEVSAFQIARIEDVIEDVNGFVLDDTLKQNVSDALVQLVEQLRLAKSNGEMQAAALNAIASVDNSCKAGCSYYKIGSSLKNLGRNDLAKVIAVGAETYRNHTFANGKSVKDFYSNRIDITDEAMAESIEQFNSLVGDAFIGESGTAQSMLNSIHLAIILSNVSDSESLYLLINDLTISLNSLLPQVAATAEEDEQQELTPEQIALLSKVQAVIQAFGYDVADVLAEQSFVFAVDKYISNAISDILELDNESVIGWNLSGQLGESSGEGGDDEKNNSGGYGEGDTKYGSDDLVYDPDTGEYVPYGQLINKYYAIVNEMLLSGQFTEEQANVIRAYFEMLLSGIKDKT